MLPFLSPATGLPFGADPITLDNLLVNAGFELPPVLGIDLWDPLGDADHVTPALAWNARAFRENHRPWSVVERAESQGTPLWGDCWTNSATRSTAVHIVYDMRDADPAAATGDLVLTQPLLKRQGLQIATPFEDPYELIVRARVDGPTGLNLRGAFMTDQGEDLVLTPIVPITSHPVCPYRTHHLAFPPAAGTPTEFFLFVIGTGPESTGAELFIDDLALGQVSLDLGA